MTNNDNTGAEMNTIANHTADADRDAFYADSDVWDHEFCDPNECNNNESCFAVDAGADDRD